ncbi:hypothetical protein [Bosea sp. PAMC 26642]|uniref:hypothetical protein n=1 Tax=Bosea sp. (strain PAMC 26642) TaxID=1792307 RepID=UPI0007700DAD|nr:hypothetical protein [Bosea sp. PAMC 26642]AMJ62460.1 hypothetical protein AXW83_21070 [Bosea sp. PAMC 26642]
MPRASTRRASIAGTATAASVLAARCSPPAFAATSPDAELLSLGAEFDRIISEADSLWSRFQATGDGSDEARALGEQCEAFWPRTEVAASRIMAVAPVTLAGLALWARVMLWRFDPTLRGIAAKPSPELDEYGVNEAFALAAAIERMAALAVQS